MPPYLSNEERQLDAKRRTGLGRLRHSQRSAPNRLCFLVAIDALVSLATEPRSLGPRQRSLHMIETVSSCDTRPRLPPRIAPSIDTCEYDPRYLASFSSKAPNSGNNSPTRTALRAAPAPYPELSARCGAPIESPLGRRLLRAYWL